jgi:glycosyltransferase involved in cell wall biosynthesis
MHVPETRASAVESVAGSPRCLVVMPVYNEERYIQRVLSHVLEYVDDVLVVDDGSSDKTPCLLAKFPVEVIRHGRNRGYGRSLRDGFGFAASHGYDWVITMDCDEQHEPQELPRFRDAIADNRLDIISGSRYLSSMDEQTAPPADRRAINATMTDEINDRLGLGLTDSFCGFKAHRISAMQRLVLTEDGYAFPMQLWVQAAAQGLRIGEIPVRLIYKDLTRTFGNGLDNADVRLAHYRSVMHCELRRCAGLLPADAAADLVPCLGLNQRSGGSTPPRHGR